MSNVTQQNSKRYPGVSFDPTTGLWLVHYRIPGQGENCIGRYVSEDVAGQAYERAALTNMRNGHVQIDPLHKEETKLVFKVRTPRRYLVRLEFHNRSFQRRRGRVMAVASITVAVEILDSACAEYLAKSRGE